MSNSNRLFGLIFILFGVSISLSHAQIRFGPKVAVQAYAPIYAQANLSDSISVVPGIGFNVGLAMDYKISEKFTFY